MIPNKTLPEILDALFCSHVEGEDARLFLNNAGLYFHAIDDVVDKDLPSNPEVFGSILIMAINTYSSKFYVRYQHILYSVIRSIHHTYFDSVHMERAREQWKKEHADVLRSFGQELTLTIIEILGGYELRRQMSMMVREYSYDKQHNIIDIVSELKKGAN